MIPMISNRSRNRCSLAVSNTLPVVAMAQLLGFTVDYVSSLGDDHIDDTFLIAYFMSQLKYPQ